MLKSIFLLSLTLTSYLSYNQGFLRYEEKIFESELLKENKIDINTKRKVKILLPESYSLGIKRYPVVYYLQNTFESYESIIDATGIDSTLLSAFNKDSSKEFILVIADLSSPTIGCLYENSSTSGKWIDFITKELVPLIDEGYRTIPQSASRALTGFFFGGYGALKLAMMHPELFGVTYAMHPVATGSGYLPRSALDVNWSAIHNASSYRDLDGTGRTQVFAAICQAYLPNKNRPPLFCDFLYEFNDSGALTLNPYNVRKEQKAFHLDECLDENSANIRSLKALAFDWARFDITQAHVISNRRLSKLMTDLAVNHIGEEFAGQPWNSYWGAENRFSTRVIPFLEKNLSFQP